MSDKAKRYYKETRQAVRGGDLICSFGTCVCPGTSVIEAYNGGLPYPVGMLWFRWGFANDSVVILNSWVKPETRRCGIRNTMQGYLIESHKGDGIRRIVSPGGTASGIAWMKAYGYKKSKRQGYWYYTIPKGMR